MQKYHNRVVIYIDILDFKGLVKNTVNADGSDNEKGLKLIEQILEIINYFLSPDKHEAESADVKITQFSDCVVLSFDYTDSSQIFYRLLSLQWLLINLTLNKVLCRGGVSIGKILHTNESIYGPALVDSYLLESKAAFYPRIVISDEIVNLAGQYRQRHHTPEDEIGYVKKLLKRDTDGLYYIDYFSSAQSELDDPEYDYPMYLHSIYEIIMSGISNIDHGVRVKYMWMKEKYNVIVERIQTNIRNGNYHIQDSDLDEAYRSLPIIS